MSRAPNARAPLKISRPHLVTMLKGQFKPYHLKYGIEVPGAYGFAHASSMGDDYSQTWTVEELEEITTLSSDASFIKGLTQMDLPPGMTSTDVIKTLWVYDAKPTRRRARLVADGRTDPTEEDTFSPVARVDSFKLVCAVIAQLRMDMGTADVKKAFFKGRFQGRRYFIWAPRGFATFPGEIWEVLVPIYGLTISARLWYQCISEFLRQIGFVHYHGDPCLFRRLCGPGISHPYPTHTDSPDWRREAPNEPFEAPHVASLAHGQASRMPSPNVFKKESILDRAK
jgi:hypothetical protein